MKKYNFQQSAQNNSKGTAQTTRKVNTIEIDLTSSTNKVEDFRKRVQSSANNINRFLEAEILVLFEKKTTYDGERSVIQKYSLLQGDKGLYIKEGDKRASWENRYRSIELGSISGQKSDWLLGNAEKVIVGMSLFYVRNKYHAENTYTETLGVTKDVFFKYFKVFLPEEAKLIELDNTIKMATKDVLAYITKTMKEGTQVDDYRIIKTNDWGMVAEREDGSMYAASWDDDYFFLPFKDDVDDLIKRFFERGETKRDVWENDYKVSFSIVKGQSKNTVLLTAGDMQETFNSNDIASIYMWIYENRHEIFDPKPEILPYEELYGTNKVTDTTSIAMDILKEGFEYMVGDKNYKVVFRNEQGVAMTETVPEDNSNRLVSFNWEEFQNWKNMPEDKCSIGLQWLVKDGKVTLYEGPETRIEYRKVG